MDLWLVADHASRAAPFALNNQRRPSIISIPLERYWKRFGASKSDVRCIAKRNLVWRERDVYSETTTPREFAF
jgi:hypothetical protein